MPPKAKGDVFKTFFLLWSPFFWGGGEMVKKYYMFESDNGSECGQQQQRRDFALRTVEISKKKFVLIANGFLMTIDMQIWSMPN